MVRLWETVLGSVKVISRSSLRDVNGEGAKRITGARALEGDSMGNGTVGSGVLSWH